MLISWKYNFLFLHIPKTGGTSLARALAPYARPADRWAMRGLATPVLRRALVAYAGKGDPARRLTGLGAHARLSEAIDQLGEERIAPLKKIAFIRNPFTHAYSLYAHILRSPSNPHHGAMKSASFADMLRQRYLPYKGLQRAYVSAADPIDFVGRFECFEEDARNLERFLGLPRPLVLERANVNPAGGPDLCEAFAGILDEFVEKLAWQFSFFGYSTDIARAHEPPAFAPAPEISAAARWGDKEDAPARRDNPCVP